MTGVKYPRISVKDYLSVVAGNTNINITSLQFFEEDLYKGSVAGFFLKYKNEDLDLLVNHVSIVNSELVIQVYKRPE